MVSCIPTGKPKKLEEISDENREAIKETKSEVQNLKQDMQVKNAETLKY